MFTSVCVVCNWATVIKQFPLWINKVSLSGFLSHVPCTGRVLVSVPVSKRSWSCFSSVAGLSQDLWVQTTILFNSKLYDFEQTMALIQCIRFDNKATIALSDYYTSCHLQVFFYSTNPLERVSRSPLSWFCVTDNLDSQVITLSVSISMVIIWILWL